MEELHKVIEELLNPKENYPNEVKVRTQAYLENIINSHSTDFGFFFSLLRESSSPYVKFWSLSALEKIITIHYPSFDPLTRARLRALYFEVLEVNPYIVLCDAHIEHKFALLFILLVREDYPFNWPDAFIKLLSLLNVPADPSGGTRKFQYLSFVLSAMIEFDREIVDQSGIKDKEAADRRRIIKDHLRNNVVNDLASLLKEIITSSEIFKAHNMDRIVGKALEVMEKLIDWTNPELFVVNLPYLAYFLKDPMIQTNSAKCIYSFIYKGMDPLVKLQLVDRLGLIAILSEWNPAAPGQDEGFAQAMATIVNKVGIFLLDCAVRKEGVITAEASAYANEKFVVVLSLAYKCLDQECVAVALNVVELLHHYLAVLKHLELSPCQLETVYALLKIIFSRIQYPKWYPLDHVGAHHNSMEEMYNYFRSELSTILGNLLALPAAHQQIVEQVRTLVEEWKEWYVKLSVPQKELPLYLFYKVGESFKDLGSAIKTGHLADIMTIVLSVLDIFSDHYVVLSAALDVVVRFAGYFETHPEQVEQILIFFLSERGILSNHKLVASRTSHEFFKFFDRLKNQLCMIRHFGSILPQLKLIVQRTLNGSTCLAQDDLQNVYQCVAIILAHKAMDCATKVSVIREYTELHLELLSLDPTNAKNAAQVVRTMTLLTRSIEYEAQEDIKLAFHEVSLQVLDILKSHDTNPMVRDAIMLYFHRMIILMGNEVLPLLKEMINLLSHNLDSAVIGSILKIETLALVTWKEKAFTFVTELYPFMLNSVIALGLPAYKVTDSDRAIVEAVCQFERLLKTTILLDPSIIFEQPIEDFSKLVEYLGKWAGSAIDETLRRFALSVLVLLLGASLGLLITSENSMTLLDQPISDSKVVAFLTTKPMHVRALLQKIEESAVDPLEVMDPNQPMDAQSCNDLAVIHVLLHKTVGKGFVEKLEKWDDYGKLREVLDRITNSHEAKEYRDVIKHIMLDRITKGGP